MRRRKFLSLGVGTASISAVGVTAGCVSESKSGDENNSATDTTNSDGRSNDRSGPVKEPESCPQFKGDNDRELGCYDDVDTKTVPAFLEPSPQTVTDGETIEFTLHNQSGQKLKTDPRIWLGYEYDGSNWHKIENTTGYELIKRPKFIEPGGTLTESLTIETDPVEDGETSPVLEGRPPEVLRGASNGYYAFRCHYKTTDTDPVESAVFGATFRIRS